MNFLFGYGSLLSSESASKTLGRQLNAADIHLSHIVGYRRTWTAPANIQLVEKDVIESRIALFLDLSISPATKCNGVLLNVSDDELARLDIRERQYERITVMAQLAASYVPAYTYVVSVPQKARDGVVLESYFQLVNAALASFSQEFRDDFWESTDIPRQPLQIGSYIFANLQQNAAAGRT